VVKPSDMRPPLISLGHAAPFFEKSDWAFTSSNDYKYISTLAHDQTATPQHTEALVKYLIHISVTQQTP